MNKNNNRLTNQEILENQGLLEEISKIDNFNIEDLHIWLEENEMRVYTELDINVYIDSHFDCYHTEIKECIDRGDYYEIVPQDEFNYGYSEKELNVRKDKTSIAEVLDDNNCHIVEADGKTYYVCLEE